MANQRPYPTRSGGTGGTLLMKSRAAIAVTALQINPRSIEGVDLTFTRTGQTIDIGSTFSGFGAVIPSAARGNAPHKYIPIYISGGSLANNIVAALFVNPLNGEMMIRSISGSGFKWSTGARFTVNLTYYI